MKRKLVIIGIDGGTFSLIDPLVERGELPNLAKIIKSGARGILKSTYPPITAAAWVTFMTGKNPGKHSFYDFREYNLTDYTPAFVTTVKTSVNDDVSVLHSSRYQGETIWDFLGNAGYEMTVVAVPMTYPPWEVNGRMVSGYPCPDYTHPRTYPPDWGGEIGRLFNMSAIDFSRKEGFVRECKELVRRKGRIITGMMKEKKGEVFSVVFSSTDFAQHYFWRFMQQKDHPYSKVIEEIYREVDDVIGDILNLSDEDTSIFVMSDHGFMRHPGKHVNINAWLLEEGYIYLDRKKSSPRVNFLSGAFDFLLNQIKYKRMGWKIAIKQKLSRMPLFLQRWASKHYFKSSMIDWGRTRAFRYRMYGCVDGLVINTRGRQKNGIVADGEEYENLRTEIIGKLLEIKDPDTGERVIAEAYPREELYHGDFLKNAPDIIYRFSPDYIGGVELQGPVISPVQKETTDVFSGVHSQDGIFISCGPNIKKGTETGHFSITDVIPTILYDLNVPIPDDLDGRIIGEVFTESFKNANTPEYIPAGRKTGKQSKSLSKEDEESVKNALKGLGYL